ncbi:MAG: terminase small subunit [Thomasclavelia ramosa]
MDLNTTQAAIRAGYSKKAARQVGNENMSKPYIKNYIEERMQEKEDSLIAKQDEVLFKRGLKYRITYVFDISGNKIPISNKKRLYVKL